MFNLKKLIFTYGLIFISIVLLSILSLVLINYSINKQQRDGRMINISGKQRMLGQRIVKTIQSIYLSKIEEEIDSLKKDLLKTVKQWEASARLLQLGDIQTQLPSLIEIPKYQRLYKELEPHFNKVRKQAYKALSTKEYRFSYIAFELSLLEAESEQCLMLNDKITNELEKDSEARVAQARKIAIISCCAIILILLLETIVIFRPMYRQMERNQLQLKHEQEETHKAHQELSQKNKILLAGEEEIRAQAERLNQLNVDLDDKVKKRTQEISLKNQTLRSLISELETKNKELDHLIYRITHDLRAPIASILGLLNISGQEEELASLKKYNALAQNQTHKADKLIRDINTFAEEYRKEVAYEDIDLTQMLRKSLESFEALPIYAEFEVEFAVDNPDQVPICLDDFRLEMIINHLLSNAISYYCPDKEQMKIKIEVKVSEEKLQMSFWDNGKGIDQAVKDRIFDMFFRGINSSPGSGLGLYLVKKSVDRLGGQIELKSEPGMYTEFLVEIPNNYQSSKNCTGREASTRQKFSVEM